MLTLTGHDIMVKFRAIRTGGSSGQLDCTYSAQISSAQLFAPPVQINPGPTQTSAGGTSINDNTAFTYGTTAETTVGGVYNSSITACTSGRSCAVAITTNRKVHVALFDSADNALTTTTGALDINIKSGGSLTDANSLAITTNMATATATGAAVGCYLQSAASTNSTNCKASAGNFYGVRAVNTTATLYYLRLYNASGAPTCSSATGFIESIPIPASATGAGIMAVVPLPINYTTGIAFCFTGGGSSTDNTNAATGVYLTIYYK